MIDDDETFVQENRSFSGGAIVQSVYHILYDIVPLLQPVAPRWPALSKLLLQ